MIASAIYTRTIGKLWGGTQPEGATDDNQEIISVEYLKRKGESIINKMNLNAWATASPRFIVPDNMLLDAIERAR